MKLPRLLRWRGWRWVALSSMTLSLLTTAWIAWPLPRHVREPGPVPSVSLLDRHGMPLRLTRSPEGVRGGWVSIEQIDADVIRAFVAAEDHRFYDHHGVDARALARATRDALREQRIVSGGSTITMQTARLLRGTPRTFVGKAAQIMWAIRLDAQLTKNQILELYLNRVPLGEGTVGVAAASQLYFQQSPRELSVGQAALLAGFARTPARNNPIASSKRASARRDLVLARMQARGYITPAEAQRAAQEPLLAVTAPAVFRAPHFTTRVLRRLDTGATGAVRTTLDLDLQTALEAEVRHTVNTLRDRTVRHAALVVLDNRTGEALAWVGSPDFFADTSGQVDMVTSPRQPGSALKPFLYGLAFDRGFTAASVLPDVPRTYPTLTGPYQPQNYDRRFRGPVRAREALASSYNVPAVELVERLGTGALLQTLRDAGFATLRRSAQHYGLGLALGNGDVTLIELANAYRGIANGGVWRPYQLLRGEPPAPEQQRFMTQQSAALVLDILSDPMARIPGFGAETPLDFPFPAASKTGTSRHFTDNWAVATTANFTVAVWVGNFSGRPMQGVSGITGAGPLLSRAVLQVARRYNPGHLVNAEAAGLVAQQVCILSGMLATPDCPSMIEWFAPGTEPKQPDTWQSGRTATLPMAYAEWLASKASERIATAQPLDRAAAPRIVSPQEGDLYEQPHDVQARYASIPLVASGATDAVRWSVNGKQLSAARWQLEKGTHLIRAQWSSGARDSVRIVVQ